jgi:hypothetical protein
MTTYSWTRSIIVIAFVFGVVFVLVHHFFLHVVHGDNTDKYPQYWIKGANNMFSQVVSICLGTAAAYSLTQAVGNRNFMLRNINPFLELACSQTARWLRRNYR